jgi:hypothetical protein
VQLTAATPAWLFGVPPENLNPSEFFPVIQWECSEGKMQVCHRCRDVNEDAEGNCRHEKTQEFFVTNERPSAQISIGLSCVPDRITRITIAL